jgi:fibronectin type 3 domain-containing protein
MNTGDRIWSAPIWINQGGTPDTTPPTTSITAPANGATVSGTTTVTASASASDNVGVTRVEFYLDNVLQSTSTTSPYQWSWNTTTSANGSHNLSSKAYDAAGNIGTSTTVTVTVSNVADTTPPTAPTSLVASTPTGNSNGSRRKINLSWTASTDNVGVTGYQIWRATSSGGPFSQIATSATTSYTNTGLTSGTTYWYYVQAYDAAGNVSAASNTASATAK